ncbi:MAG: hypothetical protein JW734_07555 [Candidatus Omnitrophica bacterium]|nr:hypothetical protein [Candidatus Omnitrophota bacterium]
MSKSSTNVLFLWHMHQPYYKKPRDKEYFLPWVRLHTVKDYYGFAKLLSKFPAVKANFNFTPVLLDQIIDYAQNNASDRFLKISEKRAEDLTGMERKFILRRFFSVNKMRMIDPYPRYLELLEKSSRGKSARYTAQEMRDLQVYFNLVWFHFTSIEDDKNLQELISKGRNFSEEDKSYILNKQRAIISETLPLYKWLIANKQIEITTSPYYHPIIPLLCDTDIVHNYHNQHCPRLRFSYPEEAWWQIKEAKERTSSVFDTQVNGSWPSEGSVSPETLLLYKKNKFKYLATDEEILFKTFAPRMNPAKPLPRHIIYRPYYFDDMLVFFRDKNLSNAISFSYHGWENLQAAANDLLGHLENIHSHTCRLYKKRMVLIAMDGENAWEYYNNNAKDFFYALYSRLEKHPKLKTNTLSSYIKNGKFKSIDSKIWPGSWINADFGVWAGSKENNRNWHMLTRIKKNIDKHKAKTHILDKAISYLRIIEGSDWNWWNTYDETSGDFEKILLSYVKEISRLLKKDFMNLKR